MRIGKGSFTLNLPFVNGTLELESGSRDVRGRQPKFEEITQLQKSVESAVSHGDLPGTARTLLLLAEHVAPTERMPAIHLHRRLTDLAKTESLESNIDARANQSNQVFEEALSCAVKMADTAVSKLQLHHHPSQRQAPTGDRAPALDNAPIDEQHSALLAHGVAMSYGRKTIFSDVNVKLLPGAILGVVGPNGSGKSTLLRVLSGRALPTAGSIRFPLLEERYSSQLAIMDQVHLVKQSPLSWTGTVEQALRMYAALRGISRQKTSDEVQYVLARFGLADHREHTFATLSTGYRIRFELAKAALGYPKILLLDEPLGQLDSATRRWYLRELRDLATSALRQTSIIISGQDTLALEQVSSDVLLINAETTHSLAQLNTRQTESSVYEIVTDAPDDELANALKPIADLRVDYNELPYRIFAPPTLTARNLLEVILDAGIRVSYLRDITSSAERYLTSHAGSL